MKYKYMGGACSTWHVCRRGNVHTGFPVVKPEGKIPFGGTSCRWKCDIKIGLKEVG
jgi:hypothetical protein